MNAIAKTTLIFNLLFCFLPACQAPFGDEDTASPKSVSELGAEESPAPKKQSFEVRYPLLNRAIDKNYIAGVEPHLTTEDDALHFINEQLEAAFSYDHSAEDESDLNDIQKEYYALKKVIDERAKCSCISPSYANLSNMLGKDLILDFVEAYLILTLREEVTPPRKIELQQQIMTIEYIRDDMFNFSWWG